MAWAVRTPTTKFLLMNQAKTPELYDMAKDPYEGSDLLEKAPERRAEMARLWNDWNEGNTANTFMQANQYQKKRLQMHEKLQKDAAKREPITIK